LGQAQQYGGVKVGVYKVYSKVKKTLWLYLKMKIFLENVRGLLEETDI
jgi:hypothetical protein